MFEYACIICILLIHYFPTKMTVINKNIYFKKATYVMFCQTIRSYHSLGLCQSYLLLFACTSCAMNEINTTCWGQMNGLTNRTLFFDEIFHRWSRSHRTDRKNADRVFAFYRDSACARRDGLKASKRTDIAAPPPTVSNALSVIVRGWFLSPAFACR